jgi:hypothetical protein
VVDRRELAARVGRVLAILDRGDREPLPPLAVQWAQEGADRMAQVAQALPGLSKRILGRVIREDEVGP